MDSKGRGGLGHTGAKSMRRLRAGWGSLGADAGRKLDMADDSTVAW